jgi:Na+/H+ antiporter NhaD/arsenite permease-like protein
VQRVEWDTLLFFFGIIFAVGGLGVIGYLALASQYLYVDLGPTAANIIIGALSAIIDNIPLMFAVLTMDPAMSDGQWLLITLTCGVGGSMLSIGSAAGVALMGQAKDYTLSGHLKWTWAIALGYAASIAAHLLINRSLF